MNLPGRAERYAANFFLFALYLGLCLTGLLCAASSAAQSATDGAVHGVVEDAAGRPVVMATATLRNLETGAVRTAAAQRDGTFLIPHLAPGDYTVTITGGSGTAVRYDALAVSVDQTTEIRAVLAPKGASQLTAAATALDPGLSGPLLLPDENDDGLMSLNGLAATQIGGSAFDGVGATQNFSAVAAGSGRDPAPTPDGDSDSADLTTGPANGLSRGRHAGVSYVFSQAAVREFHVAGSNYSAHNGGVAGSVMTTVSRSGTDTLHGSARYTVRSQAFAATNPLSVASSYANGIVTSGLVKPHDLRQSFAATLGGPVPRAPSLRYFYTFDAQRRGFPAVSSPADPNFYNLTATQLALLGTRGVTPAAIESGLNYLSSLTGETPRRADQTLNFVRFDWTKHPRAGLTLEYNAVRWNSPAGLIDAPVVARGRASLGNVSGSLDAVVLQTTSELALRTINKAHAAFLRDLQYETPQTPLAQEPAISPGGLAPEVNIGPNGLLFGTPAALSQVAYPDERRVELADTLSVVRGHHLLEMGASIAFVHDTVASSGDTAGTFRYDSGVTKGYAGGLVDFLTDAAFNVNTTPNGGCPAITAATHLFCFQSFSQSFGTSSTTFATEDWAAFAEDTWRPRRNMTVHAGVRYEYTLLPIPANPNPALDAIFSGNGAGNRGATGIFPEDRNNLGPRASVAWAPLGAGRGTVRIGYGMFFGRLPGATIRAALADTGQTSATTHIRITPSAVVACPQAPTQGFGYPCSFLAQPPGVVATTTSAVLFDRRFRLPMVQQGSLSLERRVGRATELSLGYVVNLDRQLPSSTDLNIAPATQTAEFQLQGGTGAPGVQDGEVFFLPLYTTRRTPSFGPVTDLVSNVNATYHALVASAESRLGNRLQLRAEYQWSKAIDFGQAESATPRTNGQLDPFTNGYDKGLSSLNYPWAFRGAAVWTPAPASRERWLRAAARGWQVAPIVTARAGRPYSFDLSGGTRLTGGHLSLNGSGGALYLPTVGRNTLRLPTQGNVDLRVARNFRVRRDLDLRTSAEAFNLLNRTNISSVAQRAYLVGTPVSGVTPLVFQSAAAIAAEGLNTQAFGTPTAASSSLAWERRVQMSVQLQF